MSRTNMKNIPGWEVGLGGGEWEVTERGWDWEWDWDMGVGGGGVSRRNTKKHEQNNI